MREIQGPVYVEVAVPRGVRGTFTYLLPRGMVAWPSSRVVVPFGRGRVTGYVIREIPSVPPGVHSRIKAVQSVLDADGPLFPEPLFETLLWAASYYHHPVGEVFRAAHPRLGEEEDERRFVLGEMGRRLVETWPLIPPDAPRLDSRMMDLVEFYVRNQGAYKYTYLKSKGFARSTIDRAVRLGILSVEIGLEKQGSEGLEEAVVEASLPRDEATRAWLARGRAREALLMELVEVELPVPVSVLAQQRRGVRRLIEALESRGLVRLGMVPKRPAWEKWEGHEPDIRPELTDEQAAALERVTASLGSYGAFLLQGVTGSGKTEVYLRIIEKVVDRGLGAIVLVPEISITPQLAARFEGRFPHLVSVLHSGLTRAQRAAHWRSLAAGHTRIVVGARSALFAPIREVGVIVVDEEHDASFKQEDGFRYNARDLAYVRARLERAVLVLGSATPSMETRYLAEKGRITRLLLTSRPTGRPLPEVEVVDMRRVKKKGPFSERLLEEIQETVDQGGQAILFVNRRGYFGRFQCAHCGQAVMCPRCSVALVYHRKQDALVCHYCGYRMDPPKVCPSCGGPFAKFMEGTERVVDELERHIEGIRVLRLDSDTSRYGSLRRVLARFRNRQADVLVGTQIVTKGHDFPGVTLVGVLDADHPLYMQDFRAAERAFQLLVQVAGRAGRGDVPGRVVVQTYNPTHHAIRCGVRHDTEGFFARELPYRRELGYPPVGLMALVKVRSRDEGACVDHSHRLASLAHPREVQVLGPVPAPVYRVREKYRCNVMLKSASHRALHAHIERLLAVSAPSGVEVVVDVDPLTF